MFYPLRKISEKSYRGGGGGGGGGGVGGWHPHPLVLKCLNDPRKKPALIIVGKTGCQKEN